MEGTPQQPAVPAGWYPDPSGQGLRYWDGAAWTAHTAPAAGQPQQAEPQQAEPQQAEAGAPAQAAQGQAVAPAQASQGQAAQTGAPPGTSAATSAPAAADDSPSTLEWVLSVVLPVLPLLGLIWGIYLRSRGGSKETPGNVAIVLSLGVILVLLLVL
jgi:hypothetical protein